MAATSASAALVPVTPVFTTAERLALAGFLAGRGWTTNRMPRPWTAARWAPCSSPPGSARPPSTP